MSKVLPDFKQGLSSEEARARLERLGPNEFDHKEGFSSLKILLSQLTSPLIYVLVFAGAVTFAIGAVLDTVVISLVVGVNTFLGFWQERKAAKSLEALKSFLNPMATVIRGGERHEVPVREVVVGDICLVDSGDSVPADGFLVEANDLTVNEAMLTGESRPVEKSVSKLVGLDQMDKVEAPKLHSSEADGYVFMGSTVLGGVGTMMVARTGNSTEMGKIAESLVTTEEGLTPLQEKLGKLSKTLAMVVVVITVLILAIGLIRGEELVVMIETAVAIAVAAIPEGLVVSLTVVLALGMQRIFKRKALVRRLVAAETLGSVSVICCDKTGTLTEGKMKVVGFVGDKDELVRGAILANDERDAEGLAMADWAKMNLKSVGFTRAKSVAQVKRTYVRIDGMPFSSGQKYMATLSKEDHKALLYMAGAPEVVLARCYLSAGRKRKILKEIKTKAQEGYRLIGMASKKTSACGVKLSDGKLKSLGWNGFLMFEDPLRKNVKEALEEAQRAGVKVKVITGDYKETAIAVLAKLGLVAGDHKVMTGDELERYSEVELKKRIGEVVLFARTTPEQKLKIVKALQENLEVVAMTGDGVNDAPALKAADIGVVVNEASDVSKGMADLVLLDSNFKTIVEAVREGRVMYESMRKVVTYLLTDVFSELVLIGGSLILGLPLPVTAVQILWVNLVEDGLPGTALAFETRDDGVMNDKPRPRGGSILDNEMKILIFVVGMVVNVVMLIIYVWLLSTGMALKEVRTLMFLMLATNSLFFVFAIKSLKRNIWKVGLFDNKFLVVAVVISFAVLALSVKVEFLRELLDTVEVGSTAVAAVVGLGLFQVSMIEVVKWFLAMRKNSEDQ